MFHARRSTRLTVALATATLIGLGSAASAQSIPEQSVTRDVVRHALLDTCVYGESAKDGVKKDKVVDACQCASSKAIKAVKEEEISKITETKSIPDAWFSATTEAYATCKR